MHCHETSWAILLLPRWSFVYLRGLTALLRRLDSQSYPRASLKSFRKRRISIKRSCSNGIRVRYVADGQRRSQRVHIFVTGWLLTTRHARLSEGLPVRAIDKRGVPGHLPKILPLR